MGGKGGPLGAGPPGWGTWAGVGSGGLAAAVSTGALGGKRGAAGLETTCSEARLGGRWGRGPRLTSPHLTPGGCEWMVLRSAFSS